jgi:hypothetical protein
LAEAHIDLGQFAAAFEAERDTGWGGDRSGSGHIHAQGALCDGRRLVTHGVLSAGERIADSDSGPAECQCHGQAEQQ